MAPWHLAAQFTSGFSRSFLPAFGPVLLTLVLDDPPEGSHMWVEAALRWGQLTAREYSLRTLRQGSRGCENDAKRLITRKD